MKHTLHDLIIAAAEDKNAMFTPDNGNLSYTIVEMLRASELNKDWTWKLVENPDPWAKEKEAYTETRWQWRNVGGTHNSDGWHVIAPSNVLSVKLEYTAQEFKVEGEKS